MATPLRYALITLVCVGMLLVYLPLFTAVDFLRPALSAENGLLLVNDPQFWQALSATLISSLVATGGALVLTLLIIATLWPSRAWQRFTTRLPLLLALPHVAFASAALLLFAEGGVIYRYLPFMHALPDRYGLGLGVVLAVKESGFLLWASWAVLGEKRLSEQVVVLRSLGYGRWQCLRYLILPTLLPALGIALLATTAWTLSVVDVALILGPGNPPTLAVLAWQWLNQGEESAQIKGQLACAVLLALLVMLALCARVLWFVWQRLFPGLHGRRYPQSTRLSAPLAGYLLPLCGLLCALTLLLQAHTALPDELILSNSLWLGLLAALCGAALCLLWLEWGPVWLTPCLWLPLILPALPLAAGQYQLALYGWLDGEFITVLWGHLLWVIPWMLFVLRPAWQRIDPRLVLIARTLGWHQARIFAQIKCPLIIKPLLSALAIGFSVSISQYLPTLWLGAGRVPTLTTEAVALSSGGAPAQLATQGLWQLLLPVFFFTLTALLTRVIGHFRRGLR
ncbi:ABC transporter permease subunit [Pseudocitrobacter cyperus]|uniref:ABC transporter permease subunit n=1 Tax=Pseudocitrobacter cyperus TaxID=3112843 RepID=A0ABV0HEK5_9ENTR